MKTIKVIPIILLFFVGFYSNTQGQVATKEEHQTPQELYDFHIEKMKSNKTNGWITLGIGVGALTGGIAITMNNILSKSPPGANALVVIGLASTIVSIVSFEKASKHKKEAKIQLQNGAVGVIAQRNYTGVSISFSF